MYSTNETLLNHTRVNDHVTLIVTFILEIADLYFVTTRVICVS